VTSLSSDDGKTTLAANLAITLAQAEKKVLLVDADFRQPRIAELFSMQGDHGLSTLLAHHERLDEVVCATEVEHLWLVPAGPRVAAASDLLTRSPFSGFLSQACAQYDFVIVNSPALPSCAADSIQIASQADGVLLTIDIARTRSDQAIQAYETLSSVGTKVLGVVIDAPSRRRRGSRESTGFARRSRNTKHGQGVDKESALPRKLPS
jgi:capsular exopolysaccharide synthesis family protein